MLVIAAYYRVPVPLPVDHHWQLIHLPPPLLPPGLALDARQHRLQTRQQPIRMQEFPRSIPSRFRVAIQCLPYHLILVDRRR